MMVLCYCGLQEEAFLQGQPTAPAADIILKLRGRNYGQLRGHIIPGVTDIDRCE